MQAMELRDLESLPSPSREITGGKRSRAKKQEEAGTSGEGGGGTSGRGGVSGRASNGYAGAHNLNYSLRLDRFGEVYGMYDGPCIDDASWTI